MTDPHADPNGLAPGSPVAPSGSPAGNPAAGATTSGRPGWPAPTSRAAAGTRGGPRRATATEPPPRASTERPARASADPPTRPLPAQPAADRAAPPRPRPAGPSYPAAAAPPNVAPARRRPSGARKARLRLTRIDPWSALKTSLVFSGFLFVVWMVAVIVLFLVLTVAGTFSSINSTLSDVLGTHIDFNGAVIIGIALVVGALSVVLVSALGTVVAFAYNVTASLMGGVDVTLTESDHGASR